MAAMPIDRETTAKQIATNLARLMETAGLSQAQLCVSTGLSAMTVSRILRCKQEPTATVLANMSRALGVTIDEIVFPKRASKKSA